MKPIIIDSRPWGWSHAVEERFRPLVERLEHMAEADPTGYRRRVLAGAGLGYSFVALVLAILIGVIVAIVALMTSSGRVIGGEIKIIFLLAIPTFLVLRSLWIRLDPPAGQVVTAAEAPALFDAIAAVRAACNGPPIHQVIISDDFNAAIVQHPRFGILGGYRNYLLLGLPLMQALDREAFAAVVGHEFGHLVNSDGKTGSYIYRVRATWARLSESLGTGMTTALLGRFFKWYGPWFNAYSFVLARQNEYAADRISAAVTSPATAARALQAVMVEAQRFDRDHWAAVIATADHHQQPPQLPFSSARSFFADAAADRVPHLRRALAEETDLSDTHPSLAQRLAALGEAPSTPARCEIAAADVLLPEGGNGFAAAFDSQWWTHNREAWESHHADVRAGAAQLDVLAADAAAGTLASEAKWQHAWLTEQHCGAEAAVPLYEALLTAPGEPEDVGLARFALARVMLERGDSKGIDALEALYGDTDAENLRPAVIDSVLGHLTSHCPDDPRLPVWQERMAALRQRELALETELGRLDEDIAIEASELSDAVHEAIVTAGANNRLMLKIWVCRRRLANGPPFHQNILLFENRDGFGHETFDAFMDAVLAPLGSLGPALALQIAADRKWLKKRVEAIDGCLIYDSKAGLVRRLTPF
nr:M48 family metalloprotease [Polymorphobacter sp.]